MAKARGRIKLPEERQDSLRARLMWHYDLNFEFVRDLARLLYVYERLVTALSRARHRHPDVGTHEHEHLAWKALDAAIRWKGRNAHLRSYQKELKALCDRWGLRCDWAAPFVHASLLQYVTQIMSAEEIAKLFGLGLPGVQAALLESGFEPGRTPARQIRNRWRRWVQAGDAGEEPPSLPSLVPTRYTSHDPVSQWLWDKWREERWSLRSAQSVHPPVLNRWIRIEIEYEPFLPGCQKDAENAVVKEFRRQWEESKTQYLQAGFILRDTETSLALHIHWLYLAICPQPDTGKPLGWSEIGRFRDWGKGPYLTPSAVQKAVEPLAVELGLEPSDDLKSGRPPKY